MMWIYALLMMVFACWMSWSSWGCRHAAEFLGPDPGSVQVTTYTLFALHPICTRDGLAVSAAACVSGLFNPTEDPLAKIDQRYILTSDLVDIEQIGNRYVVQPKDQHVVCTPRLPRRKH